jgi:beta-phosphoglucomutase
MIEAFIFDLDGVITDTAHYHYLAWKELGKTLGIDIDEKFNETLKGISRLESLERILVYGNKENDFSELEKLNMATDKNNYYVSFIKNLTPKDILPGIKKLLEDIKRNNIKIGLASASKNALMVLENLNLTSYFDFIADAGDCRNSKPAPDIFLMAANGLGVDPINCVGIEDSSAGVESINTAGMFSVGVGDLKTLIESKYLVEKTDDLIFENILMEYSKSIA